jgi:thiosulfate/3-mercaptopyruvate sulfurtransferase
MTVRVFRSTVLILLLAVASLSQQSDPWQKSEFLEPAQFAAILQAKGGKPPVIICTAFPILYKSKHIQGAKFAGPGGKPEGIEMLKKEVAELPKDADIVLYCGCCPLDRCPNLRPAFRALKEMGYTHVRALNIPTNMQTDWYAKNYPTESGPVGTAPAVEMTDAEKHFQESMTNVTLTGFFTVGDAGETKEDRYSIGKITKIGPDLWNFDASIKYGTKEYKATVQVPVKWAGDTPVMTLDSYLIKGQGVYSARILVFNGMYSGTWGAKDHGGKMFGKIVKNEPAP